MTYRAQMLSVQERKRNELTTSSSSFFYVVKRTPDSSGEDVEVCIFHLNLRICVINKSFRFTRVESVCREAQSEIEKNRNNLFGGEVNESSSIHVSQFYSTNNHLNWSLTQRTQTSSPQHKEFRLF